MSESNRNPVLNSPDDITEELRCSIVNNNIDTLTINYEFTRFRKKGEEERSWRLDQRRTNPFYGLELKHIDFEIILGADVHSLAGAFAYQFELENITIRDISRITDLSGMFYRARKFNHPLDGWDTSGVTSLRDMFSGAKAFNQPVGDWNTSNVTTMAEMFNGAESFNQPVGDWDTSMVEDMFRMFQDAKSFNQPIDGWDTSNVTDMDDMFDGAEAYIYSLPQPAE